MADTSKYEESILSTVNKLIGGEENGGFFAPDLIVATNTALATLTQLGVGPKEGFMVSDSTATWADFLVGDPRLSMAVTYVHLKVRLIFDPPTSSVLKEAIESQLKEIEWRAMIAADPVTYSEGSDGG